MRKKVVGLEEDEQANKAESISSNEAAPAFSTASGRSGGWRSERHITEASRDAAKVPIGREDANESNAKQNVEGIG